MKDISDKDINKFPQDPLERLEMMIKHANTAREIETLDEIKRQLVKENKKWNAIAINKRNRELLTELDKAWPAEYSYPK